MSMEEKGESSRPRFRPSFFGDGVLQTTQSAALISSERATDAIDERAASPSASERIESVHAAALRVSL
jgi:hypothetical protein